MQRLRGYRKRGCGGAAEPEPAHLADLAALVSRRQTRFVLKKAIAMGHRILVVVNKIDKPDADPASVVDKTFDLFCELG